jgi:hypothetical protein
MSIMEKATVSALLWPFICRLSLMPRNPPVPRRGTVGPDQQKDNSESTRQMHVCDLDKTELPKTWFAGQARFGYLSREGVGAS